MTLDTDILIILRAGRSSLHRIWTLLARRSIDIVLSIYDDAELAGDEFILVHRASGGKYQAAVQLFADHPDLVERYKFFWFLDDDMFVPFTSIYNVARACRLYNFVICQPSLTPDSFFSWPITVSNEAFVWRATDFIEIMCPVMRRDFLIQAIPHMRHTFTGWGQEFIWRRLLQESHELGGIIDVAPVTHTRPVGGGAIYDRYEGGAKGAFAEVLMVLQKLGIPHDPSFKKLLWIISQQGCWIS